MSLYPTLEDAKVSEMVQQQQQRVTSHPTINDQPIVPQNQLSTLYPSLNDFMGLDLTSIPQHEVAQQAVGVAPVTGQNITKYIKAEIKHGVRKVYLCKDNNKKIGITVKEINKGIFIVLVVANSPAALAGLRFCDQILELNGQITAGWSVGAFHKAINKMPFNACIELVIRDRPFERTITIIKDNKRYAGFVFNNGCITHIAKDSSAARNGLLIKQQLIEVDGRCVVGYNDEQIKVLLDSINKSFTITIIPVEMYKQMMKQIGTAVIKKNMNHAEPDF